MDETNIQVQAMIQTLKQQRNQALDAAAQMQAALVVAQTKITELTNSSSTEEVGQ